MLSTVSFIGMLAAGVFAPAPVVEGTPFTVTQYPTNPLPGEAVHFQVTGTGPHNLANPVETNKDDCMISWDFGEPGCTPLNDNFPYAHKGRAHDMNGGYGPVCCHAYGSPGTYTWTITSWTFGGGLATQTGTITVADPEAVTWAKHYYIDLNGSTAGMPAETDSIKHITTFAQFDALPTFFAPDKIRFSWRRGVTHTMPITVNASLLFLRNPLTYVDTFGTGANPKIEGGAGSFQISIYEINGPDVNVIGRDLDINSKYDPITGRVSNVITGFVGSASLNAQMSAYKCRFDGLSSPVIQRNPTKATAISAIGCVATNPKNFGLLYNGNATYLALKSNTCRQTFLAPRGDAKPDDGLDTFNDHGFFRSEGSDYFAILFNKMDIGGGWSAWGSDIALQPAFRLHTQVQRSQTSYGCLMYNDVAGASLASFGPHSPRDDTVTVAGLAYKLVVGNSCDLVQDYFGIGTGGEGGVTAYSNVFYRASVETTLRPAAMSILITQPKPSTTPDATHNEPNRVLFNTFVADSLAISGVPTNVLDIYGANGNTYQNVTAENNLLSADNMTNAASLIPSSQFSRGADFRPKTGTAAATLVTGGVPINFDGTRNLSGTTQTVKGGHGAAGAAVAATPATWTATPAIGVSAYNRATGIGIIPPYPTINVGSSNPQLEYRWTIAGVPPASQANRDWTLPMQFPIAGQGTALGASPKFASGTTLTLEVVMTDRSGVRNQIAATGSYTVP